MSALPQQQFNFVANVIALSGQIAGSAPAAGYTSTALPSGGLSNTINLLVAEWNGNSFSTAINGANLTADYPHLTPTKLTASITALEAIQTAIGTVPNGNLTNLIAMLP